MGLRLWLAAILVLTGVSGATLYSMGDNYSVDLILSPPVGTVTNELVSSDDFILTGMFTNFLGGNGGTIILIEEYTCDGVRNGTGVVNKSAVGCSWHILDARVNLDVLMELVLGEVHSSKVEEYLVPDMMDVAGKVEDSNISYAITEKPYLGWVAVVPIQMETGQNSNAFGSLGLANEQNNEQTLKGYIGFINGHDFIAILSTEPADVFSVIVSNLKVVPREDTGQAVLENIMDSLEYA